MALNTFYIYNTNVTCHFYIHDGSYGLECNDSGTLDDIHERMCKILVKHNFDYAAACSSETGEVLMVVERT